MSLWEIHACTFRTHIMNTDVCNHVQEGQQTLMAWSPYLPCYRHFSEWWRAPQQTLRTHCSHEASCATLWWRWGWWLFCPFPSNGAPVEWYDRAKPKYSGKNLSQCHFAHHKSHMDWPRDRTRASAVGGRRQTAWAMAQPCHTRFLFCSQSVICLASHCWSYTPHRPFLANRITRHLNISRHLAIVK
jgi:hypothetical protein